MEYLIAFVLIVLVSLFLIKNKNSSDKSESKTTQKQLKKEETKKVEKVKQTEEIKADNSNVVNNKDYLIHSFREGKELRNPKISTDGKVIAFHDDKRIIFCLLKNFLDKNPKFISKSVEQDVICDIAFSEQPRRVVAALKNSKNLLLYELITEGEKQKLVKMENKILKDDRKFEIKNVAFSKDANYISTIGTGQDTVVQIFDAKTCKSILSMDINEIQNSEIKMTPDDKQLTISTFMYEIAVVEFKKTTRFKKEIEGDEIILKIQRNKSLSGIKIPIDNYEFSNDNRFFVVLCENKKVKIFHNFGNFEESKILFEFEAKQAAGTTHDKVSLYVSSFFNGKLTGLIALSRGSDILIYDIEGKLQKILKNAHESKISLLKLAQKDDNIDNIILISASRDGRFHIWNMN